MRLFALAAALSTFVVASSGAAALDSALQKAAGDWRLSEVGGKIACTLTLTREASFAGYALRAPLACRRAFPALKAVAAWELDERGGIVLTDANALPIVTFPTQAGQPYQTRAPDGRTWRLEPVKVEVVPTGPPSPTVEKPVTTP